MFTAEERKAIREQLDRIVVSSPFRHGKRCPKLLRHVVEYVLGGNTASIKERALGTALFELEPNYDTALHPVVRMTAVEIRKRLTDYYATPGRENELHIDLPRGSYVPTFTFPQPPRIREPVLPVSSAAQHALNRHWRLATLFILCVAVCVTVGWKIFAQTTALASFWSPIIDSKARVLVCMPNPADLAAVRGALATNPQQLLSSPALLQPIIHDRTSFSDSVALSSVGRVLGSRGSSFFVRRANDIDLKNLSGSPAVLIGAFDNRWTLALSSQMRFSFAVDGTTEYIRDSQNPNFRDWSLSSPLAPSKDYGIVSRTFTAMTGNFLVTLAGLGRDGTLAAGDCISDASCMEQAKKFVPGDWKHKNLEIVIATNVANNTTGTPQVLGAYMW
jgi:hypothetical protein